ncbi:Putative amino-acid ABC transporter-binding protein YhdW [Seminavis robusta]|uniref:Amino-acid ABC transporter-binding protein YhdW n=1 Tax=Seminavis robusta TaxID=568900 RepID=A0A9N8E5G7_9STRA|nr:Putative amino-acid ABC transporter-binding protein YhdW [Seminavis robusta]|eukprot:Sro671_g184950.1 Putative amino-acid ABC transporter-binding protein YhdW (897) ;mRNA; f:43641-46526
MGISADRAVEDPNSCHTDTPLLESESTAFLEGSYVPAHGAAIDSSITGRDAEIPDEIVISPARLDASQNQLRLSAASTATMPASVLELILNTRIGSGRFQIENEEDEKTIDTMAKLKAGEERTGIKMDEDKQKKPVSMTRRTADALRVSGKSALTKMETKLLEELQGTNTKTSQVILQAEEEEQAAEESGQMEISVAHQLESGSGTFTADAQEPGAFAVDSSAHTRERQETGTLTAFQDDSNLDTVPAPPALMAFSSVMINGEPVTIAHSATIATAVQIDHSEVEEEIRERILREAVEADVVSPQEEEEGGNKDEEGTTRWKWLVGILGVLLIAVIVVAATVPIMANRAETEAVEEGSVRPTGSTLEAVLERGFVRCGISGDVQGFSQPDPVTGEMDGMNVDHCRAISVAVFGATTNIEFVNVVTKDRFIKLANWDVDVLAITTTVTMERQVFEASAQTGFQFSAPFFYAGMMFGGVPSYVECADNLDSIHGACRSLKVCVITGTTHELLLQELFPGGFVIPSVLVDEMIDNFMSGECHVMASEAPNIPSTRIYDAGYAGEYVHGHKLFSREPLSIATRQGDAEWTNLVNMVVNTFYFAEAHNITQANAHEMESILVRGEESGRTIEMMQAIVSHLGNYEELYQRHLQHLMPRKGLNLLYGKHNKDLQASKGLLFSYPFGSVDTRGEGPIPGKALDRILARGHLRCGIPVPGNANSGLDAILCQAIAAAIFAGDTDAVEFVEIEDTGVSRRNALDDGLLDIVAGVRVTMQTDYLGYTFSPPYYHFHSNDTTGQGLQALGMMTTDDDKQFSDFVFWVVMTMIFADENAIGPANVTAIPVVLLWGEGLKQSLRDCVYALGTYGDVYNRSLQEAAPRSGANLLNQGPLFGPQQFSVPFS